MAKKIGILSFFVVMCLFLWPQASSAAGPEDPYLGQVLVDVSRHGEAWYVNPQSRMKVFLGRPDEALERLQSRAIHVSFANISRLAEAVEGETDVEYAEAVAGYVLMPDDLIGAAWYVDPSTGLRRRLATPEDAWGLMRQGRPVAAGVIDAIPAEPVDESRYSEAQVTAVPDATTLELDGGQRVRLLSVDVPENPDLQEAARSALSEALAGHPVTLERDVQDTDGNGTLLRHVHVSDRLLSHYLVSRGLAFHDIGYPNFRHAELLIVGALDAMRHEYGFWNK